MIMLYTHGETVTHLFRHRGECTTLCRERVMIVPDESKPTLFKAEDFTPKLVIPPRCNLCFVLGYYLDKGFQLERVFRKEGAA